MNTIRGRLTFWYTVALTATVLVFGTALYLERRQSSVRELDQRLAALDRARMTDRQHFGIDVRHRRPCARPSRFQHPERNIACAARDIEQCERPVSARRIDGGHQHVFPGPVQPARHHIVHQVVAPGDLVEDVIHQCLLFGQRHRLEAERSVGGVLAIAHRG